MLKKGKFIVFYGINNLGKTTQAKILVDRLNKSGQKAEYLKYPIYDLSPSGEIINNYLRMNNRYNLTAREVQIMYANNRTQFENELIKKLNSGINVVAEDYTGTGLAWGISAGVEESFLKHVNSHLLKEDIAFLFDGDRFVKSIENGHKHENSNGLTNIARQNHLKLGEEFGWIKINANEPIEIIHEKIWQKVGSVFNLNNMTFAYYQKQSRKTAKYPNADNNFIYPALGLCGEAGEVAEKIKKIIRDKGGIIDGDEREKIKKELGDVLWYVSQLATELNLSMEEIAKANLEKLFSRLERNMINGSGDDR